MWKAVGDAVFLCSFATFSAGTRFSRELPSCLQLCGHSAAIPLPFKISAEILPLDPLHTALRYSCAGVLRTRKLRVCRSGCTLLYSFRGISKVANISSQGNIPLECSCTSLHRRIVVARCSIHSRLQLLALGGFAAQKQQLSCFCLLQLS